MRPGEPLLRAGAKSLSGHRGRQHQTSLRQRALTLTLLGGLVMTLLGCSAAEAWSPAPESDLPNQARIWLSGVDEQAAAAVGVSRASAVDCWDPMQHPVDPGERVLGPDGQGLVEPSPQLDSTLEGTAETKAFRVLCRVSFVQDSENRWRDAVCIGDTQASPAVAGCYAWAYYRGMPVFSDAQGFRLR